MREFSERSLTAAYVFALGLIALLTVVAHLTLNRVLEAHEGSAAIVNVSGRQRMLSQRIAGLAAQYRLGVPTAKSDLLVAMTEFEAAHRKLLEETRAEAPGLASSDYQQIYFGGPAPLDREVAEYVGLARRIADGPCCTSAATPALSRLFAEARQPLLSRLDEVVALHQRDSEAQLTRLQLIQRLTMIVVLATLASEALLIFRPMVRRIARYARDLLRLASTDALTGTLNRATFLQQGEAEFSRARRYGRSLSVMMIDADHFKRINDSFGHAGGDAALQTLAKTLRTGVRPSDLLGRMGGEEFALLLPETDSRAAVMMAERLRSAVAELAVTFADRPLRLTVSIGVATLVDATADLGTLLQVADQALYAAKGAGRNAVVDSRSVPAVA